MLSKVSYKKIQDYTTMLSKVSYKKIQTILCITLISGFQLITVIPLEIYG